MVSKGFERFVRFSPPVLSTGVAFRECFAIAVITTLALASAPASAQVVCTTTPADVTCTNSGTNNGNIFTQANGAGQNSTTINSGTNTGGIFTQANGAGGNSTTTNSGTDTGNIFTQANGAGGNSTTTNSGTNNGNIFTQANGAGGNSTTTNSGTNTAGIFTQANGAGGNATTTNSGSNSNGGILTQASGAGGNAITNNSGTNNGFILNQSFAGGNAVINNSGTNNGSVELIAFGGGTSSLTNSGRIINFAGLAIQFVGGPDTLTLLPGSFIVGGIQLVGTADTVNVRTANQNLTFVSLAGATVTGTVPFAVSGNRIASIDPTPFGLADKNLMDFTRAVSSILGSIGDTTSASSGPAGSNAFAAETGSNRVGDAFASIPALAYAGSDTMAFKNPTMVYADGRSVWARGFAGERFQQADDTSLRARNLFEGGAIGADLLARPDLRIGIFAGGGHSELSLDMSAGNTKTDTAFGGIYGRYAFSSFGAASFLDFALHGGGSTNATSRNINNNLLPSGLETATASYNSSYVSPEITYGVKLPLWTDYTLTPSLRLRYVAGTFGG
jgi:hypothetical protein